MFQLYKPRDFGLYFKDTFGFLRLHGKHFFKNYITVNGIFLLILVAMTFFFYLLYEDILTSYLVSQNTEALTNYLNENSGTFAIYAILFVVVGITVGILNYAFVPIYFKLFEKHGGANFSSKQIADELFANIGKLFLYILMTIIISIFVIPVIIIVAILMSITLIGIPFLVFLAAFISLYYHSALMEYLKSDSKSAFECYSYSLKLCFQKFFPSIGAAGVFMILAFVFQSIFSIIQFIVMMVMGLTSLENPTTMSDTDTWSISFVILIIIQIISYLINYLVSAVLQMNQALIYYSLKEERENINTQSTIDQIGIEQN
ncbi:hypothetical protein [Kordia sp.]|uniref:hypothetical protein n=1 Tax=Kordia sp. TaxID=1965332 RepID=UPI003B5C658F